MQKIHRAAEPFAKELARLAEFHKRNQFSNAEALSRSLVNRFPEHGFARKILGSTLRSLGRLDEALSVCRQTAAVRPHDQEAQFNLACELHQQGYLEEAAASYLDALKIEPNNAVAQNNLGGILKTLNLLSDAETCCRQAIALNPAMAGAHNNLGNVLQAQGHFEQAAECFRTALTLNPNYAEACNNLAISLKDQGFWNQARTYYEKALALRPDWSTAYNNFLFCLSHDLSVSANELLAKHVAFGEKYEEPLRAKWLVHQNTKDPERCLQVGFVSGDLFDHAVSSFVEPVLKFLHKMPSLALHAYYTHSQFDAVTERLRSQFSYWHDVAQLDDDALASQIRTDRIDVLIDLSGHTAHNRLLTFARKPAPIQASWLGYPGTTGLRAMDYHLHDELWIPPGELDWQFVEKPALLPASAVFQPYPDAPPIQVLPAQRNGYITFGSFNRVNKLNASVLVLWAMVLRQIPDAQLILGGIPKDSHKGLSQLLEEQGIEPSRLIFHPRTNMADYLALHHQIDICLDAFPYCGGTTTLHAAWMGVPTLTLAGDTPSSRVGAGIMSQLNLHGFITSSIEDFLNTACHLPDRITELATLRTEMRERFKASAMGQPEGFAQSLETLLRTMWRLWCQGQAPQAITSVSPANPFPSAANVHSEGVHLE